MRSSFAIYMYKRLARVFLSQKMRVRFVSSVTFGNLRLLAAATLVISYSVLS